MKDARQIHLSNVAAPVEPLHIISLGAGVQSSTMALMAAAGEITPMPTCAIFADTGDEPESVYRWLDWLEKQLPYPVLRVGLDRKLSDLATDVRLSAKSGNTYVKLGLPCYTVDNETGKKGLGMRQCTLSSKIEPIRRKLRELANGEDVIQWIGISTDEAHRMKPSRDKWVKNVWPLIDLGMSRRDCLKWMADAGWPKPPRSACTYCPYHNDTEWLRLKNEEPEAFEQAVQFEKRLQAAYSQATALRSTPWLHRSHQPIETVVFAPDVKEPNLFGNECEGMCGL
jgi:hypothetical protein